MYFPQVQQLDKSERRKQMQYPISLHGTQHNQYWYCLKYSKYEYTLARLDNNTTYERHSKTKPGNPALVMDVLQHSGRKKKAVIHVALQRSDIQKAPRYSLML